MTLKVICAEGIKIQEDLLNKFILAFELVSKEEYFDSDVSINVKIVKDKEKKPVVFFARACLLR